MAEGRVNDKSTLQEKILHAALQLDQLELSPFSAEALVVAAWQNFPHTFGLKGYIDHYPDSNKVLSSVVGERGLAKHGRLSKLGPKLYSLTSSGRQFIRLLEQDDTVLATGGVIPGRVLREQEKYLTRGKAEALLRVLRRRFSAAVPEDVERAICATNDMDQMDRLLDAAVSVASMKEFRRTAGLSSQREGGKKKSKRSR